MNLLLIARCNIRKNKSMTATLVLLIIFAAILLYIGTSVMLGMNSFIDRKNREVNGSDFSVFAPAMYEDSLTGLVNKMGGYVNLEKEMAVSSVSSVFRNVTLKEKSQSMSCLILNADNKEKISKLKIIDQAEHRLTNSIVVPYYLKVTKGYQTGDEITISHNNKTYEFVIYGFAEDVMFALPSNFSYYKCYVFSDEFKKLYQEDENARFFLLKTLMPEGSDTRSYSNDFVKELNNTVKDSISTINSLDYTSMKVGVSIFFIIIMVFLIVFSAIIIIIALTVIRFAVVTYIEGNIQNIGSMEALGYTGGELIMSTVLQFALISVISSLIGIAIAFSCTGVVTNLVSSSIGLMWNSGFDVTVAVMNLIIIVSLVILISYLTARKIKRITPIMALRSGIETHNFRKNHFPLDRYSWNVNLIMGLKNLMINMKQNITILIIITMMSFVSIFAFSAYYNMVVDNSVLIRLVGLEKSHLMVDYAGEDPIKVFNEIAGMDKVKETIRLTMLSIPLNHGDNEFTPNVNVCEDFSKLKINTVVKGRYPVHDNEIAVTSLVLKQLGAKLGDSITIKGYSTKEDYIVVGITQHINNLGKGACITEAGMKRINSTFVPSNLYIYLDKESDIATVTKEIQQKFKGMPLGVTNMEEQYAVILASFNKAITGFCIGCIIITLFIIALILYLLVKIKLLKERTRLGVSKALGYTTRQLLLQVVCSFLPICMIGAALGAVLSALLMSPILGAMLSIAGSIENCHFIIRPLIELGTYLAITLFSFAITAFGAASVRKITPCELFR